MRTTKYAGGGDTQTKIDSLQKLIDNPSTPENDKKNFLDAQKKFKEKQALELKEMEKPKPSATAKPVARKPTAKPIARKPTAKPIAKPIAKKPTATAKPKPTAIVKPKPTAKPTEKKLPKGVEMVSKKVVIVDGKK